MENFIPGEFIVVMLAFAYVVVSGMVCMETSNELRQGVRRVKSAAVARKGK